MTYKHIFLLPLGGFGFIHPGFQTSSSTWRGNTPNNNKKKKFVLYNLGEMAL